MLLLFEIGNRQTKTVENNYPDIPIKNLYFFIKKPIDIFNYFIQMRFLCIHF